MVYFDDILIYSPSKELHLKHLWSVCEILRKENLYTNIKKYDFMICDIFGICCLERGDDHRSIKD